jgi:hypothetical protein
MGALLLIVTGFSGCSLGNDNTSKTLDLSMYSYQDTKDLVSFVHNASLIVQDKGIESIEYFKKNRKTYNKPDYYLYIYKLDGKNLFHAAMPNIEGQDLLNITDKDGKPVTKLIQEAVMDDSNPHSWVHYSWWESDTFYPVPKSSCHFLISTPEGEKIFVGGGMNYPHEEKEFIRIIVDNAVEIVNSNGTDSFPIIEDPAKQFNFRDVRVFIFDDSGKMIIEPAVNATFPQESVLKCVDDVGFKPFFTAVNDLKTSDSTWEIFMTKNRFARNLVKKCMYIRKANLNGKVVYVGAITDLPQP